MFMQASHMKSFTPWRLRTAFRPTRNFWWTAADSEAWIYYTLYL